MLYICKRKINATIVIIEWMNLNELNGKRL